MRESSQVRETLTASRAQMHACAVERRTISYESATISPLTVHFLSLDCVPTFESTPLLLRHFRRWSPASPRAPRCRSERVASESHGSQQVSRAFPKTRFARGSCSQRSDVFELSCENGGERSECRIALQSFREARRAAGEQTDKGSIGSTEHHQSSTGSLERFPQESCSAYIRFRRPASTARSIQTQRQIEFVPHSSTGQGRHDQTRNLSR